MLRNHLRRLSACLTLLALAGCSQQPVCRAPQGCATASSADAAPLNEAPTLVNGQDFINQLLEIRYASPSIYARQAAAYQAISAWLRAGADTRRLAQFGLLSRPAPGDNRFGNTLFTGYYTPVVQVRRFRQGEFRYPIYRKPHWGKGRMPSRAQIYRGALPEQAVIAYSRSPLENFLLGVQGSGYADFGDGQPLIFLGYGGKNGHRYRSIGRVLVERGEIAQDELSLQAIQRWVSRHSEEEVRQLLEENPSFVFFKPEPFTPVRGAAGVTLLAGVAVAADRRLIPTGTPLLAEVPVLDQNGKFTGRYEWRLLVALDVGGAIKGQHLDLYQGIGPAAARRAGFFNHYGRVWVLQAAPVARSGGVFSTDRSLSR